MIYFVSDLHGDINFKGFREYLEIAKEDDLLIILGDVGLEFEKTDENREFTEFFLSVKKNIAIVDGNHENFAYLYSYPEEEWNGGTIGRISENIIHLKRGNVYNIGGKTFFTFGGCKSSDKWKEMGLWYYGEEAEKEELDLAYKNIDANDRKIDYILTHKYEIGTEGDALGELVNFIDGNVSFDKWYAGHYHLNEKRDEKHTYIYDELVCIE